MASPDDAAAIRSIYSHYVSHTSITFEIEVPSVEEMRNRIVEYTKQFPWLVMEKDGVMIAYAYATPFKVRAAYRWSVESSIYVDQSLCGKGSGKKLYLALFDHLKRMGILNIIGVITLPNIPSVAIHEKLGFQLVGRFPEVGFKEGQWWDVGYYQLTLPKPETPEELSGFEIT